MDISTAWPKSDIYGWIHPWISISTPSLLHERINSMRIKDQSLLNNNYTLVGYMCQTNAVAKRSNDFAESCSHQITGGEIDRGGDKHVPSGDTVRGRLSYLLYTD